MFAKGWKYTLYTPMASQYSIHVPIKDAANSFDALLRMRSQRRSMVSAVVDVRGSHHTREGASASHVHTLEASRR